MESRAWKLDIGCGRRKREGFIGIDSCRDSSADLLADLNEGLPFRENTFSEVRMHHVFEHLDRPVVAMDEIWRVCRDGGRVEIFGPHFSSPYLVWGDPTHRRGLSLGTFRYFDGSWYGSKSRYRIEKCILIKGNTSFREAGWRFWYWPFVIPNKLIESIVNCSAAWISRYERLASRYIGFVEIRVVLTACKGGAADG